MDITVIGAGNMGSALVKQLSAAGHRIRVTARNPDKARMLAGQCPGVVAVPAAEALGQAWVVIAATGYDDAVPALRGAGRPVRAHRGGHHQPAHGRLLWA